MFLEYFVTVSQEGTGPPELGGQGGQLALPIICPVNNFQRKKEFWKSDKNWPKYVHFCVAPPIFWTFRRACLWVNLYLKSHSEYEKPLMVTFSKVRFEWQEMFILLDFKSLKGKPVEILQIGFFVSINLGAVFMISRQFSSETETKLELCKSYLLSIAR